nr:uncharacterized protein LOC129270519 [Lytechinus pictus]
MTRLVQLRTDSSKYVSITPTPTAHHTSCGYQRAPLKPEPLIVGGQLAQHGEWPWIASLLENDNPLCGATLITPDWLLTAAHCIQILNDGSVYSILMGTTDIIDVDVDTYQQEYADEVYIHPNYHQDHTDWDIALIHLRRPMNLTDFVTTACLPTRDMRGEFSPGRAVTMSGWGTLFQGGRLTQKLREVTVPLVNHTLCQEEYYPFNITDNMICTGPIEGGKDSCQGDSGGPTVTKLGDQWWLIGVIIGGVGCAVPGFRGVSSDTIAYQDWINPIFEGEVPSRKTMTCESYDFTCQGGWCIPYFAKCDGFPDCRLETDEVFCDGVLKLFDPFFYRRVADKRSAMIITNVQDIHECARMCLDASFLCGIFEYYIAGTITDVKNETKPIYDCLITGPNMQMVPLQSPESKRINFHQFVRRIDIAAGQNAVFTSATEVILSPSYLPITPFNLSFFSSSPLSWTIYLSELNYNTLIFKMLAVKGHIDCGGCSSFSLLSVNGGGNVTATAGKVGIAKCLDEFVVGEIFYVDSSEAFITYFATDLVYTGFMLEYKAKWLCNQSFITSPGSISSPRFYSIRQAYPPNVRCHYTITAPPDHRISLHINSYQIEPDREEGACDFDSLSIFDGNSTLSPRVEYLCGFSQAPVTVLSNSSSLYLLFSSDQSGEYTGFAASFSFINHNLEDLQHEDLNNPADVTGFESFQEFINDMYEISQNSKPTTSQLTPSEAVMPSKRVTASVITVLKRLEEACGQINQ